MRLHVVVLAAAVSATQAGSILDDATVGSAIRAGQSNKYKQLVSDCSAGPGVGEGFGAGSGVQPTGYFTVITSRAAGRIAVLAADAKRLYKPFALPDVPADLRSDSTVFVTVIPDKPSQSGNKISVASPIERVVLRGPNSTVVQPIDVSFEPVEWSNLVGGTVQANSAVAMFDVAAVSGLPQGDLDVIVITAAGERRCKIGKSDRARLQLSVGR